MDVIGMEADDILIVMEISGMASILITDMNSVSTYTI